MYNSTWDIGILLKKSTLSNTLMAEALYPPPTVNMPGPLTVGIRNGTAERCISLLFRSAARVFVPTLNPISFTQE